MCEHGLVCSGLREGFQEGLGTVSTLYHDLLQFCFRKHTQVREDFHIVLQFVLAVQLEREVVWLEENLGDVLEQEAILAREEIELQIISIVSLIPIIKSFGFGSPVAQFEPINKRTCREIDEAFSTFGRRIVNKFCILFWFANQMHWIVCMIFLVPREI